MGTKSVLELELYWKKLTKYNQMEKLSKRYKLLSNFQNSFLYISLYMSESMRIRGKVVQVKISEIKTES